MKILVYSCILSLVFGFGQIEAQSFPAQLDPTFGNGGIVTTKVHLPNESDQGRCLVVQPDGKILLAGSTVVDGDTDFSVVRYLPNGSLDPSFGGGGKKIVRLGVATEDQCFAMALQADGKIVLAGTTNAGSDTNFAAVRLLTDGNLDITFSSGGIAIIPLSVAATNDQCRAVAIQADGKIVLAGSTVNPETDFVVVRLLANGILDNSFNSTGIAKLDFGLGTDDEAKALVIQPDQKIVLAGSTVAPGGNTSIAVARFLADGSPDPTFGSGGRVTFEFGTLTAESAEAVALDAAGKIVVAGTAVVPDHDFALVRFLPDGTPDSTFGLGGKVALSFGGATNDQAFGISIQRDGKIVAAGYSVAPVSSNMDFAVVRVLPNGDPDPTFGAAGRALVPITPGMGDFGRAVAIQPDGRIVVGGNTTQTDGDTDFAAIRLIGYADTDGDGFDDSFEIFAGSDPLSPLSTPALYAVFLPNFEFRFAAARNAFYTIETSFDLQAWTAIETDVEGFGTFLSRFYLYDVPKRFFRVRRQP